MLTKHVHLIDVLVLALSAVAVPVAVYHFMSGRPAQGLMALGAAIAGVSLALAHATHPEAAPIAAPTPRPRARPTASPRTDGAHLERPAVPRDGWVRDGLLAGLVAIAAMSLALFVAFVVAEALGDPNGGIVSVWFWALTHNQVTEAVRVAPALTLAAQLALGLAFSVLYSGVVAPRLSGPGWQRGAIYSLALWLLSVVLFLPLVGGGLLGLATGAGPLPVLGNLAVHLVYGATLGAIYAIPAESGMVHGAVDLNANARANRGAAFGIVVGAVLGGTAGLLIELVFTHPASVASGSLVLAGGAMGGAWGAVIGSLAGLSPTSSSSIQTATAAHHELARSR